MSIPSPSQPDNRTLVMNTSMLAAATAASPREHHIVLLEGWEAGRRLRLSGQPVVIGRLEGCDIAVPDSKVSSRHCELRTVPHRDDLLVTDLGSTNGTFIEARRLDGDGWLAPGGLLRIGDQLFRHELLLPGEAAKAEEHDRDLEKARHYVQTLLPAPVLKGSVLADWVYVPSAKLGGDAFGYQRLDEHTVACYLMDVSGHGVGAAMHSVTVMNVMRQRALPGADFRKPAQVLASLNDMFQMDAHDGMYFTMWYGVYDEQRRIIDYASAGHHAAYLLEPGRSQPVCLRTRNMMIGAVPGNRFVGAEAPVPLGSRLYVFSDGVFEVVRPDGTQWPYDEFEQVLLAPPAPVGAEARRIHDAVRTVARPGPLDDDFTLVSVTLL